MKFRTLAAAALAILALASCKKEEEEKVYMDGTLTLTGSIPKYVEPGSKYTFSASGITAPDGTPVGYYFTDPVTQKSDTVSTYTYVVPNSLGTYSLTCVAYSVESASKYYSSSKSVSFTIVSDSITDGSLQGIPHYTDGGLVTMYSRSYDTFKAGTAEWTASNLAYIKRDSDGKESYGHSYAGCPAMQNILGAFYTWEEALTACPDGWHLPTDGEWVELIKLAGGPSDLQPLQDSPKGAGNMMVKCTFNGSALWEYYRDVNIQNSTHLCAIPAGYASLGKDTHNFTGFGSYAAFWTADELDGKGVYRYIYQEHDNVFVGLGDKDSFAASVRCLR